MSDPPHHEQVFTEAQSRAFEVYKQGVGLPEVEFEPTDFASMVQLVKSGYDPEPFVRFFAQEAAFSPTNLAYLQRFTKRLLEWRELEEKPAIRVPVRPQLCDASMLQIIIDWEYCPRLGIGLKHLTNESIARYLTERGLGRTRKNPAGRVTEDMVKKRLEHTFLNRDRPNRGTHQIEKCPDGSLHVTKR